MTDINLKRWQKLAGIMGESTWHMAKNDQIASVVKKHVVQMMQELGVDSSEGDLVFDDLYHTVKRYFMSVLRESPEMQQDLHAYFGSDDSVDGPYNKIVEPQPMKVSKSINKHLTEQKLDDMSPESMSPSREDEEEAMAGSHDGKYPATASEYAKQLNSKRAAERTGDVTGYFELVDDPEHWSQSGVNTGEELAKYLAVSSYRDAFKEVHGVRPRHMNFDEMSIEEIEAQTEQLYDQLAHEDQWSPASRYEDEEYEERQAELHKDDPPEPDEYDVQFGKYEDLESDWDDKLFGKR